MAFFFYWFRKIANRDMKVAAQNQNKGDSPESTKGIAFCTYFIAPLVFPSEGAGFLPRREVLQFWQFTYRWRE